MKDSLFALALIIGFIALLLISFVGAGEPGILGILGKISDVILRIPIVINLLWIVFAVLAFILWALRGWTR